LGLLRLLLLCWCETSSEPRLCLCVGGRNTQFVTCVVKCTNAGDTPWAKILQKQSHRSRICDCRSCPCECSRDRVRRLLCSLDLECWARLRTVRRYFAGIHQEVLTHNGTLDSVSIRDKKPTVREAAPGTLGRLRPVTLEPLAAAIVQCLGDRQGTVCRKALVRH